MAHTSWLAWPSAADRGTALGRSGRHRYRPNARLPLLRPFIANPSPIKRSWPRRSPMLQPHAPGAYLCGNRPFSQRSTPTEHPSLFLNSAYLGSMAGWLLSTRFRRKMSRLAGGAPGLLHSCRRYRPHWRRDRHLHHRSIRGRNASIRRVVVDERSDVSSCGSSQVVAAHQKA